MPPLTATPLFGLTAEHIKTRANPLNDPNLMQYDDDSTAITSAELYDQALESEQMVASFLPEKYRALLRSVTGEIVVADAVEGQTLFRLSLRPVLAADNPDAGASGPAFYLDFGRLGSASHGVPLYRARAREDRMPATAYTLVPATGVVTLATPLAQGQTIHADYRHGHAPLIKSLAGIIRDHAVASLFVRYPSLNDKGVEAADRMERSVKTRIDSFFGIDGTVSGIDVFDEIRLIDETRSSRAHMRMPMLGGW